MSFQQADGKGSGSLAEVKKNRTQVDADIHSALEEHAEKGNAYSWHVVSYNYAGADTILGIRNISATKLLHIDKIFLSGDTATVVQIHVVPGSAALAGTVVTGVNLNFSSGDVAEADARADETTNSAQGTRVLSPEIVAATMLEIDLEGALILGTNDSFAIDYVTVGGAVEVTVLGFFDEPR